MKSISTLKMYRVLLIFVERTQCGVFEDLIIFFCNGMSLMIPSYSSPAPTIWLRVKLESICTITDNISRFIWNVKVFLDFRCFRFRGKDMNKEKNFFLDLVTFIFYHGQSTANYSHQLNEVLLLFCYSYPCLEAGYSIPIDEDHRSQGLIVYPLYFRLSILPHWQIPWSAWITVHWFAFFYWKP